MIRQPLPPAQLGAQPWFTPESLSGYCRGKASNQSLLNPDGALHIGYPLPCCSMNKITAVVPVYHISEDGRVDVSPTSFAQRGMPTL